MKIVAGLFLVTLALVAPSADGFFWGCSKVDDHESLISSTGAYESVLNLSPAKLYLRSARKDGLDYSCIEMTLFDEPQEPPPQERKSLMARCGFFAWLFGNCGPDDGDDPETEPEYEYTLMVAYYDSNDKEDPAKIVRGNFSISDEEPYKFIMEADLPKDMFGSDGEGTTTLTFAGLGEGYAVFRECVTGFLSFSRSNYAYMFINEAMMDLEGVDVKCMAAAVGDELGFAVRPAGVCSTSPLDYVPPPTAE